LFLSLKEDYGLMVFEGRGLRCIFGVDGGLSRKKGKLDSVEVHYVCFSVRSSRPNEYSRMIRAKCTLERNKKRTELF